MSGLVVKQACSPASHQAASEEGVCWALNSRRVHPQAPCAAEVHTIFSRAGPASRQIGGDDVCLRRRRHCELTRMRKGGASCPAAAWPCSCTLCTCCLLHLGALLCHRHAKHATHACLGLQLLTALISKALDSGPNQTQWHAAGGYHEGWGGPVGRATRGLAWPLMA